jgi:anti-sigma B factor antagonist
VEGDRTTPIELNRSGDGATAVIEIVGDLDPHTSPQLDEEVASVLDDAAVTELVLDLAGLEFIDSSGIRSLIRAQQALEERRGSVVLRAPSAATRRLLEITHLQTQFEVD